jgi:hypothetical protein
MASSETETEATLLTETQFDWEHHNLCNQAFRDNRGSPNTSCVARLWSLLSVSKFPRQYTEPVQVLPSSI